MNGNIKYYLDYYMNLSSSPEYAILIEGKWGSGKTYFLKEYFNDRKDFKVIYISLYGLSSIKSIESMIFQQIHPVLGSKGMKMFGNIVSGLLKSTVRIDLNNDDKDDLTINSSLPEYKLIENFNKIKNKILVFDDLERSDLAINKVLGYINNLVENDGQKVVLIANEDEIISLSERQELDYRTVKEKLVGKTFKVKANVNSAYKSFLKNIEDEKAVELLETYENKILSIFSSSGYHNLRHLKRSIENFELFIKYFPDKYLANIIYNNHLVELFFILSIEIEHGNIEVGSIDKVFPWRMIVAGLQNDNLFYKSLVSKYPILDNTSQIISAESWEYFFKYGTLSGLSLDDEIKSSSYFIDELTPDWSKLWHFIILDDDEMNELVSRLYEKLCESKIEDQFVLTHTVGIFVALINLNLIEKKKKEIIKIAKLNVDRLKDQKKLVPELETGHLSDVAYAKQYRSMDDKSFLSYRKYLKSKSQEFNIERQPDLANNLMIEMESSFEIFASKIIPNNEYDRVYYSSPILKHADEKIFFKNMEKLNNRELATLTMSLSRRYSDSFYLKEVIQEKRFLIALVKIVRKYVNSIKKKNTLQKIRLIDFITKMNDIIEMINKNAANNAPPSTGPDFYQG